jgi:hypothetical protein
MSFTQGKEIPKAPSDFYKIEEGENKFRILADSMTGWKYNSAKTDEWIYSEQRPDLAPNEIKTDMFGKPSLRFFISAPVWSYKDNDVKIFEISQITIMEQIEVLENDSDWGDVKKYDIKITKTGKGKETKYAVHGNPKMEAIKKEWLDILESKKIENPRFEQKWREEEKEDTPKEEKKEEPKDDIKIDNLPF